MYLKIVMFIVYVVFLHVFVFWGEEVCQKKLSDSCQQIVQVVIYVAEVCFFKHFQQTERSSFCAMCGLLLLAKGFLAAPWMIWMAGTQRNLKPDFQYSTHCYEPIQPTCFWRGFVRWSGGAWLVIPFFPCISKLVDPSLKDYSTWRKSLKTGCVCTWLLQSIIVVNWLSSWLTHNVGPWGPLDFTTQPTSPTFSHLQPFWGHATLRFLDFCISPYGSLSSHPLGGECLSDGWRSSEHDRSSTVYHCGSTCLSGCVFSSSGPMLGKRILV